MTRSSKPGSVLLSLALGLAPPALAQGQRLQDVFDRGVSHFYGSGVAQSDAEAALWFSRSADLGQPLGLWWLGWAHANGRGVEQDPARAADLILPSEGGGVRQAPAVYRGLPVETRATLQEQLRQSGPFSGSVDGNLGAGSLAALRACAGE